MPHLRHGCAAALILASSGALAQDVSPNWFRNTAISPDGRTVLFTHAGDIYTVSTDGGRAIPLTIHEASETLPVWSPDGSKIAFASDRAGNFDVYVMPSTGGEAQRLTFHSSDDLPSCFSPDGESVLFESTRVDDADSALFPSRVLAELYSVSVSGGTPDMVLTTPALNARWNSDGARILYEDRKGYEDELRKHHTSAIARDVWVYDASTGEHEKLTTYAGEDRNPQWGPNGREMVFLSERNGDMNVFRVAITPNAAAEQLTSFEHHPVRHLSTSDDGRMAFSWHGDVYVMNRNGQPWKVDIEIAVEGRSGDRVRTTEKSGASEFDVSPNGKEIAFVVRGEVYVTSVEFGTTRRITNTPEQERSVDFAPDGRTIVYAGERDGSWNIYKSTIADDDEQYFFSATKFTEEPVIATDAEEFQPLYSPDGEKIAYLHNRSRLNVIDVESGDVVTAAPGDAYYSYSDGDYTYDWSPDSRWLALHFYNRGRAFVSEVGFVRADGSSDWPIDVSNSGYEDNSARFAMKGGALIWASDRYGERSHGSWGSEFDVLGAFLTQDAYDRFKLSKEEYELKKELEDKKKKEEDKDDDSDEDTDEENGDDGEDSDDDKEEKEEVEPIEIDLEGIETRIERLTIHASDLGDFALTPEGDKLFYLARFEKGYDLWVHDFRDESTKILKKLGANSASMELSEDAKTIFMLANGSLSKIDASSGEQKSISFSAELDIDAAAERAHLFEHMWRQTAQKFYRRDMHDVDWEFYREQYEPKLAGIHNTRDLAEMFSEILGELNASHTGGRYRPGGEEGDESTAALGAIYDNDFDGPGVRIAEVLTGGPLDKSDLDIEAGMTIVAIDGAELTDDRNYYELLDGKSGDRVRLTLRRDTGDEFDAVVRPTSLGGEGQLLYERWVRTRRQIVDEASNGRLGYMHVRGMNDSSYRAFYAEALGRHFDKEGLIVDTRFNGGGWLHDDLVTFLTGTRYVDLYPRTDEAPDLQYHGDSSWRWTKPSVVVMSESNYSDAHFFPWAYSELNIGPTVGMPVPGTATAVWWETLHTGDLIFGIPQVGTKGDAGVYLENTQLEPDHLVTLPPEDAAAGRDTQLLEAVRILLDEVEAQN